MRNSVKTREKGGLTQVRHLKMVSDAKIYFESYENF